MKNEGYRTEIGEPSDVTSDGSGKYIIALLLLLITFQQSNCAIVPSIEYKYFNRTNAFLGSVALYPHYDEGDIGILDDLTVAKLSLGTRIANRGSSLIYDLGIISYQSLFQIPIIKDCKYDKDKIDLGQGFTLGKEFSTFLTFSYQGLSLSNSGLYNKDYNWSSVGVDLLYKNFNNKYFYSRLSLILSANTIKNDNYFFNDIDSIYKSDFCINAKISSISKWIFDGYSSMRIEAYYRNIFNYLKQKEICVKVDYHYQLKKTLLQINTQLGYTFYGVKDNWNNFPYFSIGLGYRIRY